MIYKYYYIYNNKKWTVNLEAATFSIKKVKFDKNFSELVKIFFQQFLIFGAKITAISKSKTVVIFESSSKV